MCQFPHSPAITRVCEWSRGEVVANSFVGGEGKNTQTERQGLELVTLLVACAESISSGHHEAANYFIARLGGEASPRGTPIHRVAAYFTEALALRVVKLWPRIFTLAPPWEEFAAQIPREDDDGNDDAIAWQVLNHVSPIPKFLHFTLNERLIRAFQGKDRIHIIDFDIKQGLQWPSLFQSLSSRPNPPSHVRITGIGESRQDLQETGARLARFAEELNLPFAFHAVADRLDDVRLWMLHVNRNECVAVNCVAVMHKALHDESGAALASFLSLLRSANPEIVVTAEKEVELNKQTWEMRLVASIQYCSAVFDALGSCLPENSAARIKVEEMFAREMRNVVACEGNERVERYERFNTWKQLMEDGGFRCGGIGEREVLQSRMILRMNSPPSSENYSVEQQGESSDGITLKWMDQPLYTVSAWIPADVVAGTSSTAEPS